MAKTLLVIQSYAKAGAQVAWSWPHYCLPGWDILGVCPQNSAHAWPVGCTHVRLLDKDDGYSTPSLIRRWVSTFACCLEDPAFAGYDDFCVIEYDGVFLRKPPAHPGGLFTHYAGSALGGKFRASAFYHTPWWVDRAGARVIVDEGRKLIGEKIFEGGSPDVFLGLILDRRKDIRLTETDTFSVNGGDLGNRLAAALATASQPGCFYAHGLRKQEELRALLGVVA